MSYASSHESEKKPFKENEIQNQVISLEVKPNHDQIEMEILPEHHQCQTGGKLNKAYLRKLDRKFDRLFKGTGRLTNTSKSVYSFEGEILSEEEEEYNSDSSLEAKPLVKNEMDEEDEIDKTHSELYCNDEP